MLTLALASCILTIKKPCHWGIQAVMHFGLTSYLKLRQSNKSFSVMKLFWLSSSLLLAFTLFCCEVCGAWCVTCGASGMLLWGATMWLLLLLLLFAGGLEDARNVIIEAAYAGLLLHRPSWDLQSNFVARWRLQYRHAALWGLVCFALYV